MGHWRNTNNTEKSPDTWLVWATPPIKGSEQIHGSLFCTIVETKRKNILNNVERLIWYFSHNTEADGINQEEKINEVEYTTLLHSIVKWVPNMKISKHLKGRSVNPVRNGFASLKDFVVFLFLDTFRFQWPPYRIKGRSVPPVRNSFASQRIWSFSCF